MSSDQLPEGWSGAPGVSSDQHYTRYFHHEDLELMAEWYWDAPPGDDEHTIRITDSRNYHVLTESFETEEEADNNLHKILKRAAEKVEN